MAEPRKPNENERRLLEKAMRAERKRRDKAVNNKRQTPGSNKPSPKRTRKQIMDDLT